MKFNKKISETISKGLDITVINRKNFIIFVIFAIVYLIKKKKRHGEDFVLIAITLYVTVVLIKKLVKLLNHKKTFNNV